jgi:hypothetical protein
MAAKLGYFPTKPNIDHKKNASHQGGTRLLKN